MKNPPTFQLYVRDWLADAKVRMMTHEARGVFIDLLCYCWENDGLPTDTKLLAKLVTLRENIFRKTIWPQISDCFIETNGVFRNRRLDSERAKQITRHERRVDAAKARWIGESNADAMHNQSTEGANALKMQPAIEVEKEDAKAKEDKSIRPKKKSALRWQDDPEFSAFWKAYPRKINPKDAFMAWKKISPDLESLLRIMASLENHKRKEWAGKEMRFVPHATTWLNAGGFESDLSNEPIPDPNKPVSNRDFTGDTEEYEPQEDAASYFGSQLPPEEREKIMGPSE